MKKIFWRVFVYFSVVLMVFTIMIGLMFTRFNRTNIVGAYKQQLGDLGAGVAQRTSRAVQNDEADAFLDYMKALEDFGNQQDIDVWILSNPGSASPLSEDYTTMDVRTVKLPEETKRILESAYNGKKKNYSDYDDIYKKTMLHIAVPIRDNAGEVMGAVVTSGPMEMQENIIIQYEKYMLICVLMGLLMAVLLAFYFSRQLVRPIIRIKEMALVLAAGQYDCRTGITRRDELGSLAESMDILSDRLVQAEEYREDIEQNRRDFFSNVSHELRTPIAVVKGYADTMAEGYVQDPVKQKEYLRRIQNECGSMERLVSDLLILSRMQNPDYELNREVLNVIAVAQDAMRSIRILMSEKDLTGSVTYEDECSLVDGDYDRIRQLFTILLQNAVKYSDQGTQIVVHIVRENDRIVTTVKDQGQEGSGLGLVVAKSIVERHGGRISVRSDKESGTIFFVEFPETSENIS